MAICFSSTHFFHTVVDVRSAFFHWLQSKLVGYTVSMPEAHTKVLGKDRPTETYLQPANEDTQPSL